MGKTSIGADLRVRLFGPPIIEGPTGAQRGAAAQRHRLALLGILASSEHHRQTREKVVCLLWPDADLVRGRQLLNSAVYTIRGALGQATLWTDRNVLGLNPDLLWVDAVEFRQRLESGRIEEAVELYAGPFLDGLAVPGSADFDHWVDAERGEYERLYRGALKDLAERSARDGAVLRTVEWRRKLFEETPWEGEAAVALIEALEHAGQRAEALLVVDAHARFVRDEFGEEPDPAVGALADRLRKAPLRIASDRPASPQSPQPEAFLAPEPQATDRTADPVPDAPALQLFAADAVGLAVAEPPPRIEPVRAHPSTPAPRRRASARRAKTWGTLVGAGMAAAVLLLASFARPVLQEFGLFRRESTLAYRSYVEGLGHEKAALSAENVRRASASFGRATALDSRLGEAWAGLSRVHMRSYVYWIDPEQDHLALAIDAAERAVRARPDLPEARLALAVAQYHAGNVDRALTYAEGLVREGTTIPEAFGYTAQMYQRKGRWEEAAEMYTRAAALSPLDPQRFFDLGLAQQVLGHYPEALAAYEHSIEISPAYTTGYIALIRLHLAWHGDVEAARRAATRIPVNQGLARQSQLALLDAIEGRYQEGLDRLAPYTSFHKYDTDLTEGLLFDRLGQPDSARVRYARFVKDATRIDSIQTLRGGRAGALGSMKALALALQGDKATALRAARAAAGRTPLSSDAVIVPGMMYVQAQMYAALGERTLALATLHQLSGIPSLYTVSYARLDPFLASLQDDPALERAFPEVRPAR